MIVRLLAKKAKMIISTLRELAGVTEVEIALVKHVAGTMQHLQHRSSSSPRENSLLILT